MAPLFTAVLTALLLTKQRLSPFGLSNAKNFVYNNLGLRKIERKEDATFSFYSQTSLRISKATKQTRLKATNTGRKAIKTPRNV